MLRTLTLARSPTFTHLRSATRRYSIPTPSPSTQKNQPLNALPTSPNKKSKIDLRPGPIKSKPTLSSSHPSIKRPPLSPADLTVKLSSVKEDVVRDFNHAKEHGILTPPPAGASWVKRTLHQVIELFVRLFHHISPYVPHLAVEILLPWCEAHIQPSETYCIDQSTY